MLLAFASAVFLGSEFLGARDHILTFPTVPALLRVDSLLSNVFIDPLLRNGSSIFTYLAVVA
jgi:hypothetical protein